MIQTDIIKVQGRILLLAKWHEKQRDALPWLSGDGHAVNAEFHDTAAADCNAAALVIDMIFEKTT